MEQNNQADNSAANNGTASQGYRLYKKEKLCSVIAIEQLFGGNGADCHAALAYPLRAVWRENPRRSSDAPVQFLISIPKKKLRHAVDRVQMRRRVREAYRLNRHAYPLADGKRIDVAFIYVAKNLEPYAKVESAIHRLLKKIANQ
jgi:ribonuclease P protein component